MRESNGRGLPVGKTVCASARGPCPREAAVPHREPRLAAGPRGRLLRCCANGAHGRQSFRRESGARLDAGARDGEDNDVAVVFTPKVAAHLRSLADALLRNGEFGAFKAYVEVHVRLHSLP